MLLPWSIFITLVVTCKPALEIIQKLLEEDQTLPQRTTMPVKNITCLLEFCLTSTYFTFQDKFYEQVEGAAMGSPISPIVANLYMEDFEMRALNTAPQPPLMWKRFVDDTCVIIKAAQQQSFLNHINSIDKNIQFTSEEPRLDGSIPFLDILLTPSEDGKITTAIMLSVPNIVCKAPYITGQTPYAQTLNYCSKKSNI